MPEEYFKHALIADLQTWLDIGPVTLTPDQLTLLLCVAILAVSGFLIAWSSWRYRASPYYSANWLLTRGEADFYEALRKAVPHQFHIIYKVRLGDVVRCSDRDGTTLDFRVIFGSSL